MPAPAGPTVLVADDEPLLRGLMQRILAAHGCRVLAAADGDEALAAVASEPHGVDVVVLDLVMPHDGGAATLQRIVALQPDIGIVLTSGLPPDPSAAALLRRPRAVFLQKPFAPEALRRAVAELGRRGAG